MSLFSFRFNSARLMSHCYKRITEIKEVIKQSRHNTHCLLITPLYARYQSSFLIISLDRFDDIRCFVHTHHTLFGGRVRSLFFSSNSRIVLQFDWHGLWFRDSSIGLNILVPAMTTRRTHIYSMMWMCVALPSSSALCGVRGPFAHMKTAWNYVRAQFDTRLTPHPPPLG